jgi:hypothetical protein
MKKITAKFNSKCSQSGLPIKKGESIWYDTTTKKVYKEGKLPENTDSAGAVVQANEEAFFDNWYARNYTNDNY